MKLLNYFRNSILSTTNNCVKWNSKISLYNLQNIPNYYDIQSITYPSLWPLLYQMVGFLKHPAVIHFESHGFWSSGERGMFSTYQGQNGRRVNFYHEHHNGGEIYIWIGNEAVVLADVLSKQSGTFSTKTTYCLNPKKSKLFFYFDFMKISLFAENNNTKLFFVSL